MRRLTLGDRLRGAYLFLFQPAASVGGQILGTAYDTFVEHGYMIVPATMGIARSESMRSDDFCLARMDGFICNRDRGHINDHGSYDKDRLVARWSQSGHRRWSTAWSLPGLTGVV